MDEFLIRKHKIDTFEYLRSTSYSKVRKCGNARDTNVVEIDKNVIACSLAFWKHVEGLGMLWILKFFENLFCYSRLCMRHDD